MAFKRALWHSGLQYRHVCERCQTVVDYDDYALDFRPWYPDGFVYCPKCKGPMRHNEKLAINPDGTPYYAAPEPEKETSDSTNGAIAFCPNCGKKYQVEGANFCPGCGKKLN